jgi:hypothetical protein
VVVRVFALHGWRYPEPCVARGRRYCWHVGRAAIWADLVKVVELVIHRRADLTQQALDRRSVPVMSETHKHGEYEIRIRGHLDSRWAASFDGLSLTYGSDGTTLIHGPVVDQAALHGLLRKVRDVGLPLVSVIHVESDLPDVPSPELR